LVEFFVEQIKYSSMMYFLKFKISFDESIIAFVLSKLQKPIKLIKLIPFNNLFNPIQYSLIIFLNLLRQRLTMNTSQPRKQTESKRHINHTDELFSIFLNVVVKKIN